MIQTLLSIINAFFTVLKYIVSFIVNIIVSGLLTIIEFLLETLRASIAVAYNVLKALWSGLIRFGRFIRFMLESLLRYAYTYLLSPLWERVAPYFKSMWAVVKQIWQGIKGVFNAIINPFLDFINRAWDMIKPVFEPVIQSIRSVVVWIRENIIIRYLSYVARIVDYFQSIRLVARAVVEARKGNIAGAIWALAKLTDEKTANAIESAIAKISADIESVRNSFMDIVASVQNDLAYVWDRTKYIEDSLDLMYEAFGIPAIGELRDKVRQFREKVVEEIMKRVNEFGTWIQNQFSAILHPIYNIYQQLYTMIWAFEQEERLARAMKYIPYRDGLIQAQSIGSITIMIPQRLSQIIQGR